MDKDEVILKREKHVREDGWLYETVSDGYDDEPFNGVHSYIVSINPGCTRAKHYHLKKDEWIAPAAGKTLLLLENPDTKERVEIPLDADGCGAFLAAVRHGWAHAVRNNSNEKSAIVVYSKTPEGKGDTYPYEFE